jgi:hypothetical protein
MAVPEGFEATEKAMQNLERQAWQSVFAQWGPRERVVLAERSIEWLITDDPAEVENFQPAHDCEECRKGNVLAREYLAKHPGGTVAMANIHYVEVRPEYELPSELSDYDRHNVIELLDMDKRINVRQAVELIAFARQKGDELRRAAEEQKAAVKWKSI